MRALFWKYGMVEAFRLWLQGKGLAHKSIVNYCLFASQWVSWCSKQEIDYIKAGRSEMTWFVGDYLRTRSATTSAAMLLGLRQFGDYLVEEAHRTDNPARAIRAPRRSPRPVEPFTDDELRRMYAACRDWRERAIFLLLSEAGLRRAEVYGVRRDSLSAETGTICVFGKFSEYRYVRPGPLVLSALRNALEFEEVLCPFSSEQYVWRVVKGFAKRAGIKGRVHPHRFRHTFSTRFLDAGGTIEELQIILGHKRIEQSLFYAKAGRQQRAMTRMQEIDLASRLLGSGAA